MDNHFNKNTPYRYERKFTATAAHRSEFIFQIKKHPAFFREIFYTRQINNIYFDTPGLKFYKDNIIGIAERKKVRIRWYGDTAGKIIKPKLEYKIKSGLLGTKWTFDLVGFNLGTTNSGSPPSPPQGGTTPSLEGANGENNKNQSADQNLYPRTNPQGTALSPLEGGRGVNKPSLKNYMADIFKQSNLPKEIMADLKMLSPTLINSYKRTYFLSADKKYRLTFDEELKYYNPKFFKNNINKKEEKNRYILELKYGQNEDHAANNISKLFPYRLDKSSKYVSGIELIK